MAKKWVKIKLNWNKLAILQCFNQRWKSIFCGGDRVTKTLVKKVKMADYQRDEDVFTLFKELDEKITSNKYTLMKISKNINA